MPDRTRVQHLIEFAQSGKLLDAWREFYTEDATAQENSEPPRVGLPAIISYAETFLSTVAEVHRIEAVSFVVDGDRCAIQWVFDWTDINGKRIVMDEIAYQKWREDRVCEERYFYSLSSSS